MLIAALVALATYTKPVTAICVFDGAIYVGTESGQVQQLSREQQVIRTFSSGGDRVGLVTASPYGVAWLTGSSSSLRERLGGEKTEQQTLSLLATGKNQVVRAVIQPAAPVRRIAWLSGRVAVSYDFGSEFFDVSGHKVSANSFMTPEIAVLAKNASLWVRELADGTELAAFAQPYSVRRNPQNQSDPLVSMVTAYQVGSWQWVKLGGFASTAFDAFPQGELQANEEGRIEGEPKFVVLSDRVGLSSQGVVAREPGSLLGVPLLDEQWEIVRTPVSNVPGDSLWFGVGDSAWWWTGSALVQMGRSSGETAVYMPWNRTAAPTCFAADGTGIWIGSRSGLSLLVPEKPELYAGFVRIPYGIAATAGDEAMTKALTDAIFSWRFADAERAGSDGGKMIAAIFSKIGKALPSTVAELEQAGTPVLGDLRFGDVLINEKSAGIYLGNGVTVQVRGGKVVNGDVWSWPAARVLRFI